MIHINKLLTFFLIILISLSYIAEANALNTYTLEYDANGNTIKDNFYSYEYNSFNQLKKVYNSAGQLIEEYKYDENSERILKKEYFNGETQTTYYVSKDFIRVVNSTGSYDFVYYYDDRGNLLGRKDPDGKKYFYHPDHLGSTSLVTDEEGNVVEETSYTPFGALLSGGKSKFLYTGKEKDQTGLYYYGARYYNANFGRFTQPDTIIPDVYDPQSLNRYSYVRNNPYKYVDPDGHVFWIPLMIAGIAGVSFLMTEIVPIVAPQIDAYFMSQDINNFKEEPTAINALILGTNFIGGEAIPAKGKMVKGVTNIADSSLSTLNVINKNSEKGFATKELLKKHFVKHGNEFGFKTAKQYENAAKTFAKSSEKNIEQYIRNDGGFVKFNKKTGDFLVISKKGEIKTYFKPEKGYDYYLKDKLKYGEG